MTDEPWYVLDARYRKARCWRCRIIGGQTLSPYFERTAHHDLLLLRPVRFACAYGHASEVLSCGWHLPGPTLLPLCPECHDRRRVATMTVEVGTPWPDSDERRRAIDALHGR